MSTSIVTTEGGVRVKCGLKKRVRDPYWLAVFRDPDGNRREKSTGETSLKRADLAAAVLIREAYKPRQVTTKEVTWEQAIAAMAAHMAGDNLRPSSVKSYRDKVQTLRATFPGSEGPAAIIPSMAEEYKIRRAKAGKSPHTIRGDLNKLSIVYRKWWIGACKLLTANPFEHVHPPKADKLEPRRITPEELSAFLDWLAGRWDGWRLPILFLEVKGAIGCRIAELASAPTSALADGRITFTAENAKGRKSRRSKLPPLLYDELTAIVGGTYLWETFTEGLRAIHASRGRHDHAASTRDFAPERMIAWLEDQQQAYFTANPSARRFKLHNFRGLAMSRAKEMGISYDAAALAFGCHPETMRRHYVVLDETSISDDVMDRLHGTVGGMTSSPGLESGEKAGRLREEAARENT